MSTGTNTFFTVTFTPAAPGIRTATIHVNNSDCSKADFDFAVQGNGTCIGPSIISCPVDTTLNAAPGSCRSIVTYTASASGTPVPTLTYTFTGASTGSGNGTGSGSYFYEGITHVIITASSVCGNASCNFDIAVFANTNDSNACTIDGCDASGVIFHIPINVDDNNLCTTDGCDPLTGPFHIAVNPDDSNHCTIDGCNPLTGIYHNPAVEICCNHIDDDCDSLIDENCHEILSLRLFIQGFYIGGSTMRATVDPLYQPMLCDTVIIGLHDTIPPYNEVYKDTSSIDIYGAGNFNFPFSTLGHGYYIATHHRSAIETWSSSPVIFNDSTEIYSFADSISEAYGNNLFDLGDGNWALWSGDISNAATLINGQQDGMIEYRDYLYMEQSVYIVVEGYVPADITGDGLVESLDYSMLENAAYFMIISMHP